MTSRLARAAARLALAAPLLLLAPALAPAGELVLETVAEGLESPVDLVAAPGDPRLYVVEQGGRIRVISDGVVRPAPFLDLADRVSRGDEQGLLSMAFHPDYPRRPEVFVSYTDRAGDSRIVRLRVPEGGHRADPASAAVVLAVEQPWPNHNGGHILFGPDGMLYVGLGDGGSAGDPRSHARDPGSLLGKILRLDVDRGTPYAVPRDNPFVRRRGARGEIWALGLRNPWRFCFDPAGRTLYVADVGQDRWEEVNAVPARRGGLDYGWNSLEATHCFLEPGCDRSGRVSPVLEYGRDRGCSVIGGRVYRGSRAPSLRGHYVYGDYCGGWIESFRLSRGRATARTRWQVRPGIRLTAFGEDAAGELYVLDRAGRVLRVAGTRP